MMKLFLSILILAAMAVAQSDIAPPSQTIPVDQENAKRPGPCWTRQFRPWADRPISIFRTLRRRAEPTAFYHGRPSSLGVLFWRFYKYPDKDRIELTKQRDVIYVYAGDKGTEITYKGPHPQDPKDLTEYLRRRHFSLDWVLRKWLSEPGVACFTKGKLWPNKSRSSRSRS